VTTDWRLREVLRETGLAVLVIEATGTWNSRSARYFQVHARLDTVAVVVITRRGVYAWDPNGDAFDLDRARARIPEFDSIVESAQ